VRAGKAVLGSVSAGEDAGARRVRILQSLTNSVLQFGVLPDKMITKSDLARGLGMTRGRISQLVRAGFQSARTASWIARKHSHEWSPIASRGAEAVPFVRCFYAARARSGTQCHY
jgi:hypothetical protein